MMVQVRVTFRRIAWASCSAALGSRYSLRYFTELLLQPTNFLEVFEDALGFLFVDHADGEADVNKNIFSDLRFRSEGKIDFFADAAEVDLATAEGRIVGIQDFDETSWNGETHGCEPRRAKAAQKFRVSTARLKP